MTHPSIEPIHGSPYAIRHDGSGHDPTDNTFSEEWATVLKMFGDEYLAVRRFPDHQSAIEYVSVQLKAVRERREDERN